MISQDDFLSGYRITDWLEAQSLLEARTYTYDILSSVKEVLGLLKGTDEIRRKLKDTTRRLEEEVSRHEAHHGEIEAVRSELASTSGRLRDALIARDGYLERIKELESQPAAAVQEGPKVSIRDSKDFTVHVDRDDVVEVSKTYEPVYASEHRTERPFVRRTFRF